MLIYYNNLVKVYHGDSLVIIPQVIPDNTIDLLLTSPPFPLLNPKPYGNPPQNEYVDWFLKYVDIFINKIKPTGSIIIDFGNTFIKGIPAYNVYQFEILCRLVNNYGLYLAQPMYWHNPSRLPLPYAYVCNQKIRVKDVIDNVWWLTKDPDRCKSDTTKVLKSYSKSMLKYFKTHDENTTTWKKGNGALPTNLLSIPNTNNNTKYHRTCRKLKLKPQPSTMPQKLVEFFIKMLTDENDTVLDIFSGSNTTGYVSQLLNRQSISIEQDLNYIALSSFRFIHDENNAEVVYNNILNKTNIPINVDLY